MQLFEFELSSILSSNRSWSWSRRRSRSPSISNKTQSHEAYSTKIFKHFPMKIVSTHAIASLFLPLSHSLSLALPLRLACRFVSMRVYSIAQLNDTGEGEESTLSSWGGAEAAGAAHTEAAERERKGERESMRGSWKNIFVISPKGITTLQLRNDAWRPNGAAGGKLNTRKT